MLCHFARPPPLPSTVGMRSSICQAAASRCRGLVSHQESITTSLGHLHPLSPSRSGWQGSERTRAYLGLHATHANPIPSRRQDAAVLCHGLSSHRDGFHLPALADALAAAGVSSLRIDMRGNGESEGAFEFANMRDEARPHCLRGWPGATDCSPCMPPWACSGAHTWATGKHHKGCRTLALARLVLMRLPACGLGCS